MAVTLRELIEDVEGRVPSGEPLELLATASASAAELGEVSDALLSHFVDRCRRAGLPWSEIGGSLGVTKQAVQKRFTPRDGQDPAGWERYTVRAKRIVTDHAPMAARMLGHGWTGTEHVLLGFFGEPGSIAAVALERQGVTGEAALVAIRDRLGVGVAQDGGPFTPRAWLALEGAVRQALTLGHNYVGTEHQLLSLLSGVGGVAEEVLTGLGVTPEATRTHVVQLLAGYQKPAP